MMIFRRMKNFVLPLQVKHSERTYSQEGEDQILRRILRSSRPGFYVDVGAHHPIRFSNTYYFYRRGWKGINVDAMPGSALIFNKFRPKDINLELVIDSKSRDLTYYIFEDTAYNTLDAEIAAHRVRSYNTKLMKTVPFTSTRLDQILAEYLPKDAEIDFLTIDVEGLDYQVVLSNDWNTYRPKIVLAETIGATIEEVVASPMAQFLADKGYKFFSKTVSTVFFIRDDFFKLRFRG